MKKNNKQYSFSYIVGLALVVFTILVALISCVYTPYDPDTMDAAQKFAHASVKHLMGCDNFGRDILSRVMVGTRTTVLVGFFTVLTGVGVGTIVGAVTGYFGGVLDEILMRFNDSILAFPSILLALVIVSVMGSGTVKVTLALGIVFIPSFARIVRGEFLRCKNLDYVKSARLLGASDFRIIFVHILPNTVPVILSSVIIGFNNAVLAEAGMSFLGIGVQPPDSSLGRMLSEAQTYLFTAPMYAVFPGLMIVLMILGFSLFSNGLKQRSGRA